MITYRSYIQYCDLWWPNCWLLYVLLSMPSATAPTSGGWCSGCPEDVPVGWGGRVRCRLTRGPCRQGLLYAFDRTEAKVARLAALAEEQGLSCVRALCADSTRLVSADSPCQLRQRHMTGAPCPLHADGPCRPPFPPDTFDCVLVDAPCSGLGQRPRLAAPPGPAQRRSYGPLQRRLLAAGADLLRPGGRLVYSTCTVPPAENERQVAGLLAARSQLRLEPAEPRLGGAGLAGHGLDAEQCRRVQRFAPQPHSDCPDTDTIGFFIACFSKAES